MSTPTPGAAALTAAANRRWRSLSDLTTRAAPACPSCGGKGWVTRHSDIPFIGGTMALACHCTKGPTNE